MPSPVRAVVPVRVLDAVEQRPDPAKLFEVFAVFGVMPRLDAVVQHQGLRGGQLRQFLVAVTVVIVPQYLGPLRMRQPVFPVKLQFLDTHHGRQLFQFPVVICLLQ